MRRVRTLLAGALLLAGCADILPREDLAPNPEPSPERGTVFLFNGLTFSSEGNLGTGTYALAEAIRAEGVRAEITRPSGWEDLADSVLRDPRLRDGPIAAYGYSYGAQAALRFATRLEAAGVPVQTVVVLEAWRPVPVPCGVGAAIHFYLSEGALSQATLLTPARPGCATVENIRLDRVVDGAGDFNHYTVATSEEVHRAARSALLDGARVKVRSRAGGPRAGMSEQAPRSTPDR